MTAKAHSNRRHTNTSALSVCPVPRCPKESRPLEWIWISSYFYWLCLHILCQTFLEIGRTMKQYVILISHFNQRTWGVINSHVMAGFALAVNFKETSAFDTHTTLGLIGHKVIFFHTVARNAWGSFGNLININFTHSYLDFLHPSRNVDHHNQIETFTSQSLQG